MQIYWEYLGKTMTKTCLLSSFKSGLVDY